ncbi:MAG: aspartate/glutamate racemase family protein [Aquabacterium sp.]|nr:aspartate/glutamate racemase family protein [Aquabacterium sp.]
MPAAPHLLLINPNTSAHVTALLARHALALAPPGAVLTAVTAPFGEPYIASEAAAAIADQAVPAAWAAHHAVNQTPASTVAAADVAGSANRAPHAVLIACFGDPGVAALRALTPVPVLGLAEVAMRTAQAHGRYAIVTGGAAWGPMLQRLATLLGLDALLAGVVTVERTGAELLADPVAAQALLLDACHQALALGGVQSIVIGGAALADLAAPLALQLPVPLIDNVRVGLQAAWEAAVRGAANAPA